MGKDYDEKQRDFEFAIDFTRLMALNEDLTRPTPKRMIGGSGPFDFSGADDASAVELKVKVDNGAESVLAVDVSSAGSVSAVTLAELAVAFNATLSAASAGIAAEVDTGAIKLVTADDKVRYVQVWGEAAEVAKFGQGKGLKFVKRESLESFNNSLDYKDSETFSRTDASGQDYAVTISKALQGFTGTLVDVARSFEMRDLIHGGKYMTDAHGDVYYVEPTRDDERTYFFIQIFSAVYEKGENQEKDLTGYSLAEYRKCTGEIGDSSHAREIGATTYAIEGKNYRDENNEMGGFRIQKDFTQAEYAALDVKNV